MAHVLARLSGFGWTLVPFYPFRFERVARRPRAVRVIRDGDVSRGAVFDLESRPEVSALTGTANAEDVAELSPSTVVDDFRVETSVFTAAWPEGFAITSSEPGAPCPFDYVGEDGTLIFLQGPVAQSRVARLDSMCAPGQRLTDGGAHPTGSWVELAYEHDGRAHVQRHTTVAWGSGLALIVTAQAPLAIAERMRRAALIVVESLRPSSA
jgi:hypothetical protein